MTLKHQIVREQRRWKWLARLAAKRHFFGKLEEPDGVNHALIQLKVKLETDPCFGKVILIGCACNSVFWRDLKRVPEYQIDGDWAGPFRQDLGVRTRPSQRDYR